MSDVKPVAWGLFARVDGKFVLQHPVRFSREYCERDVKMYGPDLVWNIQPLIAGGEVTALQAEIEAMRKVYDAAAEWSSEREPKDHAEAELMKALWRHDGDRKEPCPECDGECGEPCAPITAEEAIAGIDRHMAAIDAAIAKEKQQESLK